MPYITNDEQNTNNLNNTEQNYINFDGLNKDTNNTTQVPSFKTTKKQKSDKKSTKTTNKKPTKKKKEKEVKDLTPLYRKENKKDKYDHSLLKSTAYGFGEIPGDLLQLGGIISSAGGAAYDKATEDELDSLIDNKSYGDMFLDRLQNSTLFNLGHSGNEFVRRKLNVPPYDEMTTGEKASTFAPYLIPSKFVTGLVKKAATKVAKDTATKSVQKEYKKVLQKGLESLPESATKEERLQFLKQANQKPLTFRETIKTPEAELPSLTSKIEATKASLRPNLARTKPFKFSDFVNPFTVVPSKNELFINAIKKGMSPEQAVNTAMKQQLTSYGVQATLPLALNETLAYGTESNGVFGDYTHTQDEDDIKKANSGKNAKKLATGAAIIGSVLLGIKGTKYLNNKRVAKVVHSNELNKAINESDRVLAQEGSKELQNNIVTNLSDKNAWTTDPAFKEIVKHDKDNVVQWLDSDAFTTTENAWKSNNLGQNVSVSVTPETHYNNLVTLSRKNPELYKNVENFIDRASSLQNAEDTYYKSFIKNPETGNVDYKALANRDTSKFTAKYQQELSELKAQREELLKNPATKQILEEHSELSKALLDYQHNAGLISDDVYNYLLSNRNLAGTFSYKKLVPVKDTNIFTKAKDFLLRNKNKNPQAIDKFAGREGYLENHKPYLEVFPQEFQDVITNVHNNTKKKNVLRSLLEGNRKFVAENEGGFTDAVIKSIRKYQKDIKTLNDNIIAQRREELKLTGNISPTFVEGKGLQPTGLYDFLLPMTPSKQVIQKFAEDAIKRLSDASRIEYLGKTFSQTDANKSGIKFAKSPFELLNRSPSDNSLSVQAFVSRHTKDPKRSQDAFKKQISDAKVSDNIVSYMDNGEEHYFRVSPMIKKSLEFSPDITSNVGEALIKSKRLMQKLTTGNLNPSFSTTSYLYGLQEGLAALKTASKEAGVLYKPGVSELNYIKNTFKAMRDYYNLNANRRAVKNFTNQLFKKELGIDPKVNYDKIKPKLEALKYNIDNSFLTRIRESGAVVFNDPNDLAKGIVDILPDTKLSNRFINTIKNIYGDVRGSKIITTIQYMQESLRNASNIGMIYHLAGENAMKTDKELRNLAHIISNTLTDSKKSGNYEGALGTIVGGISKYTPYGNVMIQSLASKLHNSGIKNLSAELKAMYQTVKHSDRKVYDAFNELIIGVEALGKNSYVQGLVVTAGIPAIIEYLWNHADEDRIDSYYSLNDYDKASKFMLTDMFGKGKHLAIPVDQEVMVVQKLIHAILDTFLGGSSYNKVDPAFKNTPILMKALSRSLGINNVIAPEAALNLSGFRSDLDPENMLSGEIFYNNNGFNQLNADASQTKLLGGLLSTNAKTLINTVLGSVGTTLANGLEEGNIGLRDNDLGQGFSDFLYSTTRSFTRNNPFYIAGSKFNYRGANQTYQMNKKAKQTRETLAKLLTLYKNITKPDSDLARRATIFMTSDAKTNQDVSKIEKNLPLINEVNSLWDKGIEGDSFSVAELFDAISATYKQMNLYNATGRDKNGNVVTAKDRLDYNKKKNLEVQDLSKEIYVRIKDIENILTKKYGRVIKLDDINTIIGE